MVAILGVGRRFTSFKKDEKRMRARLAGSSILNELALYSISFLSTQRTVSHPGEFEE
jgi:hypothetical protein